MEIALTLTGLAFIDAVVTQMLKDVKKQSLVIFLRVATTGGAVLYVAPEIFHLFDYARSVLLRWS